MSGKRITGVRITSETGHARDTKVIDIETDKIIENLTRVEIEMDAQSGVVSAILHVILPEVSVEVDEKNIEIKHVPVAELGKQWADHYPVKEKEDHKHMVIPGCECSYCREAEDG